MGDAALSHLLLSNAFAFTLIMSRCGAALMLLPAFAEEGPPGMLRVGLAMALTVLLVPVVGPAMPPEPQDFGHLAGMIAGELVAGGLLGWLARVICLALPSAGQIISLATGQSSVLAPDANFGAQTSGLGQLLGRAMPVLILSSGLYALPLNALAGSYAVFRPGYPFSVADLTELSLRAVSAHFMLAVRLAAPFLLLGTIWQAGLGLLSRLVPQIQIYFAALPGQVLGGLLLLSVLIGGLSARWLGAVAHAFAALPGS